MHANLSVKMENAVNKKFRADGVGAGLLSVGFLSPIIYISNIRHSSYSRHFLRIFKFSPGFIHLILCISMKCLSTTEAIEKSRVFLIVGFETFRKRSLADKNSK